MCFKGDVQGSLMGPFCKNVLCIDLFYLIRNDIRIFNYADDNTIMCYDENIHTVLHKLENMSIIMIEWFENNCMNINPDTFNAIIFDNDHNSLELNFNGTTVESMNEVKLLKLSWYKFEVKLLKLSWYKFEVKLLKLSRYKFDKHFQSYV